MEKLCLKGFVQSFWLISTEKKNFFGMRLYDVLRQIYRINFFLSAAKCTVTLNAELRNNRYLPKQFQFYLHKRYLNNRIFGLYFGFKREGIKSTDKRNLGGKSKIIIK